MPRAPAVPLLALIAVPFKYFALGSFSLCLSLSAQDCVGAHAQPYFPLAGLVEDALSEPLVTPLFARLLPVFFPFGRENVSP